MTHLPYYADFPDYRNIEDVECGYWEVDTDTFEDDTPTWDEVPVRILTVREDNNNEVVINRQLLKRQGISRQGLERIKKVHKDRMGTINKMKVTDDPKTLQYYASMIRSMDFQLQSYWGFPQSVDFHRWWNVPKCLCPFMDNEDAYGTKYNYYNSDCIIHGSGKPKFKLQIDFWYSID